jgi:hypothetical protein
MNIKVDIIQERRLVNSRVLLNTSICKVLKVVIVRTGTGKWVIKTTNKMNTRMNLASHLMRTALNLSPSCYKLTINYPKSQDTTLFRSKYQLIQLQRWKTRSESK